METTTAEAVTAPSGRTRTRTVGAAVRRWWVVGAGLGVMALAWWSDSSAGYVAGLVLVAVALAVRLRRRRVVAAVAVAVALAAGLAGPWLGVRQAYRPTGVAVSASISDGAAFVTSTADVTLLTEKNAVVAVDGSGAEVWRTDLPRLVTLWPLPGGHVAAWTFEELVVLSAETGEELWARPARGEPDLVAAAPDVVVTRECAGAGGEGGPCTWSGLDVADGTTVWEVTGSPAPAWPVTSRDAAVVDTVRSLDPSVFAVALGDGSIEVHDAATGETEQVVVGPDVSLSLLRDTALVFRTAQPCTVELPGPTGPQWTSEYPCALRPPFTYPDQPGGTQVGDAYWGEPLEDGATLAVDLQDGTVREQTASAKGGTFEVGDDPVHVLGAEVDVDVTDDRVVVRDPGDGTVLWGTTPSLGGVVEVRAAGDLVVVTRQARPLLLREWFGPDVASEDVVEVFDAATGELRAAVRPRYWAPGPENLGDRVLLGVPDTSGEPTLRIIGAPDGT